LDPAPSAIIQYTNIGKTTARHIKAKFFIELTRNGESPHFERVDREKNTEGIGFSYSIAGIMDPNEPPHPFVVQRERQKIGGVPHEMEPDPTTDIERTEYTNGDIWIATYGILYYDDTFGVPHWVKFCNMQSPKPLYGLMCAAYSDQDDN